MSGSTPKIPATRPLAGILDARASVIAANGPLAGIGAARTPEIPASFLSAAFFRHAPVPEEPGASPAAGDRERAERKLAEHDYVSVVVLSKLSFGTLPVPEQPGPQKNGLYIYTL